MRRVILSLCAISLLGVSVGWYFFLRNLPARTLSDFRTSALARLTPILELTSDQRFIGTIPEDLLRSESLHPNWRQSSLTDLQNIFQIETEPTRSVFCSKINSADVSQVKSQELTAEAEGVLSGAMLKLRRWQEAICRDQLSDLPRSFFAAPPFIHPLGESYAWRFFQRKKSVSKISSQESSALDFSAESIFSWMHVQEISKVFAKQSPQLGEQKLSAAEALPINSPLRERLVLGFLSARGMEALLQGVQYYRDDVLVFVKNDVQDAAGQVRWLFFPTEHWLKEWENLGVQVWSKFSKVSFECTEVWGNDCFSFRSNSPLSFWLYFLSGFSCIALLFSLTYIFRLIHNETILNEDRQNAIGILAHELRTPLSTLHLLTDDLRDEFDQLSPHGQKSLLTLFDEIQRLVRFSGNMDRFLINQTHDKPLNHGDGIHSLTQFLTQVAQRIDERISLHIEGADREVSVSAFSLEIVLQLLLKNALTHGRAPVQIKLNILPKFFTLAVLDSGELSSEQKRLLGRPFSRGRKSRGLGLGLNLAQSLLKKMGSQLHWKAKPTTFYFKMRV